MTITKESARVENMGVASSSCFGSLQSTMSKYLQVASYKKTESALFNKFIVLDCVKLWGQPNPNLDVIGCALWKWLTSISYA